MTGYEVAKRANVALTEAGLKTIPPQMVYNYIKKGFIPSENGRVTEQAAEEWICKYVTNKAVKATSSK